MKRIACAAVILVAAGACHKAPQFPPNAGIDGSNIQWYQKAGIDPVAAHKAILASAEFTEPLYAFIADQTPSCMDGQFPGHWLLTRAGWLDRTTIMDGQMTCTYTLTDLGRAHAKNWRRVENGWLIPIARRKFLRFAGVQPILVRGQEDLNRASVGFEWTWISENPIGSCYPLRDLDHRLDDLSGSATFLRGDSDHIRSIAVKHVQGESSAQADLPIVFSPTEYVDCVDRVLRDGMPAADVTGN